MTKTFLISSEDLLVVNQKGCWPAENMAAHGAEGSKLTYIGSIIRDTGYVFDYFVDEQGRYWYRNRMRLPNGQIVSMEKYLFGTENIRKKHRQ